MKPFLILSLSVFLLTTPSKADCTSPAGIESQTIYDTSLHAPKFCNGSEWVYLGTSMPAPAGAVMYFAVTSCPTNWLEANGNAISRTGYGNLYAAIGTVFGSGDGSNTFNLPDLRGEFIRGYDHGRGADSGRSFGTAQLGSDVVYPGYIGDSPRQAMATGYFDRWTFIGASYDMGYSKQVVAGTTIDGITLPAENSTAASVQGISTDTGTYLTNWNIARGTRPRNVALLPCIKY